jgi:hypothetical protein
VNGHLQEADYYIEANTDSKKAREQRPEPTKHGCAVYHFTPSKSPDK